MCKFPQCTDCKNFIGKNNEGVYICSAFPNGIDNDVFWGEIEHNNPLNGDNGIQFAPIENNND